MKGRTLVGRSTPRRLTVVSCLILASLLVTILIVPRPVVHAATPLSVGQWAHYTVSGTLAPDTVDSLFTVISVNGNNVTFTDVDTYTDGSNTTQSFWVDVSNGPGEPSSGYYFAVLPGKTVGVSVYPGNPSYFSNLPITDLSARTYALSSRQTAHVQAVGSAVTLNDPYTPTKNSTEDFYWDNTTGMFTEIVKKDSGSTLLHVTMSSTDIWNADNPFDAYVVPAAIVTMISLALVVILVFAYYKKRH